MRSALFAMGALLGGLVLFEVSMQPSWTDRRALATIFLVMTAAMATANWLLPRLARRNRSIRVTVAVLALTGMLIVVGGAIAVADRMFLSEHDLTLLLIVMAFGVVSAIAFAMTVSRTFTTDLDVLSKGTEQVAMGSLRTRIELDRHDEVGRLASAIDEMIAQLESAESKRNTDAEARLHFFAAVGHDLRTPLASLRAGIEALQDGLASDPHRYLASMDRDVSALSSLVEDVFLLARIDSGQVEAEETLIDLTEMADEAIDVLGPIASSRGITVDLLAPGRVIVRASPEALGRVMRNLIDNAIRHSPDTSRVGVEVDVAGGEAIVRVTDEGAGFSEQFVPVAFDRFSRDDPARSRSNGGSGLGLAIAEGFVKSFDGEIWAEPGPGGRIGFRLPMGV